MQHWTQDTERRQIQIIWATQEKRRWKRAREG